MSPANVELEGSSALYYDTAMSNPEQRDPGPRQAKLARTVAGDWAIRAALVLAGLGFVAGFFFPWLTFGTVASLSGLALLITEGDAVSVVSGPHRMMLLLVPLFGAALCAAGIYGHRLAAWLAVFAGCTVLLAGVTMLVIAFFDATGTGMWLVTASSFVSVGVGIASIARRRSTPR